MRKILDPMCFFVDVAYSFIGQLHSASAVINTVLIGSSGFYRYRHCNRLKDRSWFEHPSYYIIPYCILILKILPVIWVQRRIACKSKDLTGIRIHTDTGAP